MSDVNANHTVEIVIKDEDGNEIISRQLSKEKENSWETPTSYFDFAGAYEFLNQISGRTWR